MFMPAVKLMERFRYRSKFALIFILLILPLVILGGFLVAGLNERIDSIAQKQRGIEYIVQLRDLIESIPEHRGMTNGYLGGNSGFREKMLEKRSEIDVHFAALELLDLKLGRYLRTGDEVEQLKRRWLNLKARAFNLSAAEAFEQHTDLVSAVLALVRQVFNASGLMLDSNLDSYYLMEAVVKRFPVLVEAMGQARGIASGAVAAGKVSSKDNVSLNIMLVRIKVNHEALTDGLEQAFEFNTETRKILSEKAKLLDGAIQRFANILDKDLLDTDKITAKTEKVFKAGTEAITTVFSFIDATTPVLSNLLEKRINQNTAEKYFTLSVLGVVVVTLLYLFAGFYCSVLSTTEGLSSVIRRLTQGDLSARADLTAQDEMSEIAAGFNTMAETLEGNQQREREQIEQLRKAADIRDRVDLLLAHVKQVEEGDLSHAIELQGEDDLGQLSIHLNSMTQSLSGISVGIREVVESLNTTLAEVSSVTSNQVAAASQQASAVNEITATLAEIRQTSEQTLNKAKALGGLAQRTRDESNMGRQAVQDATESMEAIRSRVDGIAQTILTLSEKTQQIGEITAVVNEIAQQSKMLALNASLEAAKAGDAGKGFSVVAEEVKALAEQSQQSTAQVQKILHDIRQATDRAVMATEEGTKGVDIGVQKVQRTGELMQTLDGVVNETAIASKQIVEAAHQETVGIEQVNRAMGEINDAVMRFVTSTKQTEEANSHIVELADKLRNSVEVYKVR